MKILPKHNFVALLVLMGLCLQSFSWANFTIDSGLEKKYVVQLYTSEGCSSCPPADTWLSGWKQNKDLWSKVIPIAFHVDYWNYLGWKDPFGSREFSQRQHALCEHLGAGIFTPAVILDNELWRNWHAFDSVSAHVQENSDTTPGRLWATIDEKGAMDIRYKADGDQKGIYQVEIFLLRMNAVSQVRSGENTGKDLKHDFVVYGVQKSKLTWNADLAAYTSSLSLDITNLQQPFSKAIALWVTRPSDGQILQAAGDYWPDNHLL